MSGQLIFVFNCVIIIIIGSGRIKNNFEIVPRLFIFKHNFKCAFTVLKTALTQGSMCTFLAKVKRVVKHVI